MVSVRTWAPRYFTGMLTRTPSKRRTGAEELLFLPVWESTWQVLRLKLIDT